MAEPAQLVGSPFRGLTIYIRDGDPGPDFAKAAGDREADASGSASNERDPLG
jgi:hypothetical protein